MRLNRKYVLLPLLALATVAVPATAQTGFSVGAKVVDTAGAEVGTVTKVDGDSLIVKTDKHEVALPRSSFAAGEKGLLFALTQAQLNAEVEKSLAAQGPVLSVGATVYDPQGGVVGTVETFDDKLATVKLPKVSVQLPVEAFVRGPNGPMIGETAASLEAKAGVTGG